MKCPMLTMYAVTYSKPEAYRDRDCLKEECAWWDEVEEGRCAILSLVGSLDDIATKLMHIDGNIQRLADRPR